MFFSDSCLGLHSYTPTDAISPTASLPLLASLACFFNDSSRMLLLLSDACIYNGSLSSDCFFLTLVSDYILIHPQIQSRLRLRYLCSLRSPVFFNDSSRKLLLISGACINNGSLSSDCFFSDSCVGLRSYTPTDSISPTASLPLLASLACFFFNDSPRKLLLISDAGINNGSLSSYWASSSISRSALLSLPLSLLTPEPLNPKTPQGF